MKQKSERTVFFGKKYWAIRITDLPDYHRDDYKLIGTCDNVQLYETNEMNCLHIDSQNPGSVFEVAYGQECLHLVYHVPGMSMRFKEGAP